MKNINLTHCLVGIVAAVGLLLVLGVQAGTLVYGAAALACPLMMVFMMRGMMGGHGSHGGHGHSDHQHAGSQSASEPAEPTR